MYNALDFTYIL